MKEITERLKSYEGQPIRKEIIFTVKLMTHRQNNSKNKNSANLIPLEKYFFIVCDIRDGLG